MTAKRWKGIQELFERVSVLRGEERERVLSECTDSTLLQEVRQLLANLEEDHGFLESPPQAVVALRIQEQPLFGPGDHIVGRFEVVRLLGSGGMGEVYEVQDHTVGERVALKTLRPDRAVDRAATRALRDELRRARRVTHPNVCRLHELFETEDWNGLVFFTMELLEGETLASRLQRKPPMNRKTALVVLNQIAAGLEVAHLAGILHRDLKPSNIFLIGTGETPRAVITDFGMAYRLGDVADSTSLRSVSPAVGGTPGYMAPEQYNSCTLTPAVDVYAIGVIAHELIYGCRPSEARVRLLNDSDASRWAAAITKATAAAPADRYQSPAEFVAACSPSRSLSRRGLIACLAIAAAGGGTILTVPRSGKKAVTVAVIPFEAARESDEHWAEGLTDALIRVLRSNPELVVMGQDSVSRFKRSSGNPPVAYGRAGAELKVEWLVGGNVARNGHELQTHVELIRARGNAVFWSTTLHNQSDQLSLLSRDLAKKIGGALSVSLAQFGADTQSLQTNQEALDHYLKGRTFWNRRFTEQLIKARGEFEASVAADPNFALAYCGLADVFSTLADYHAEPPVGILPLAKQAAITALGLNSRLADCHVSFAHATALNDGDWSTADISFKRAIALDSSHPLARQWYAILLMKLGRRDECLAQSQELVRIDPFSASAYRSLSLMYYFTRNYRQALVSSQQVFDMSPSYFGLHELVAECYARLGDRNNAVRECEVALGQQQSPGLATTWAAVSYAVLGMRDEAEKLIFSLTVNAASIRFQPTHIARAWAELGEMDRAFEWLERAFLERDTMLQMLPTHVSFDLLRLDARYPAFFSKLRITYPSRA